MIKRFEEMVGQKSPKNGKFYTIAIDGRGGSGKTTLAKYMETFLPGFVFLNGDDYFEPANDGVAWGAFNEERFYSDVIRPIQTGVKNFIMHPYDWHAIPHMRDISINISKGICLERSFSFEFKVDWDYKIWVETPKSICLERGLVREHMSKEKSLKAWLVWQVREDIYINENRPQKTANVIIDGAKPFESQIE